ncbi:MAG: aromatic ring-opening dioxygenase LigA [Actinomycetota bacterium]|nr:aromatic ring-opening dioxygenase LigA [Actinomycetota bacterium]
MSAATTTKANPTGMAKPVRLIALLLMLAGLVMVAAGAVTWFTVQSQLADERITVSEDADWFAGDKIDGPLTAYSEAQVIEKHALEASKGKTYAELDREDPVRATVMNGSFLRASLFTSVVSFGIAAMAMGLGVVIALIGYALFLVARRLAAAPEPAV